MEALPDPTSISDIPLEGEGAQRRGGVKPSAVEALPDPTSISDIPLEGEGAQRRGGVKPSAAGPHIPKQINTILL